MQAPAPGGGGFDFAVSAHMLSSAAGYLHGQAQDLASHRDSFNGACFTAHGTFGTGYANTSFNNFFAAWFGALDAQAETLESAADGTQRAAVVYDHAERHIYGTIAAMRTQPPPPPPPSQSNGGGLLPGLNNPPPEA